MKKNGYTLVEMLVVLAIIALMMTIMLPRLTFQQKGAGLKGAATEVMTALRAARRAAITNRELRALALDIYSIPAEFVVMRPRRTDDPGTLPWIQEGEQRQLPANIAIVAIMSNPADAYLDARRTDDNDFNGVEDTDTTPAWPDLGAPTPSPVFNPDYGTALPHINPIYRLIRFYPTGTADRAVIYLWNITEGRLELPPVPALPTLNAARTLSNFHTLGVPPGLKIHNQNLQSEFFTVHSPASTADSYYYTVVVNPVTGGVTVYDYAWGDSLTNNWDRKKDGA